MLSLTARLETGMNMSNQRLLLVNLRSPEFPVGALPLALPTLGAAVHAGIPSCAVAYFDRQLGTWSDFTRAVQGVVPTLVGVSAQLGSVDDLETCLDLLRRAGDGIPVVVGNVTATYASEKLLERHQNVLFCIGRGEETLVAILENLGVNSRWNWPRSVPNVAYWDAERGAVTSPLQPVPDELVVSADWSGYFRHHRADAYEEIWVESSRGCPQKKGSAGCVYCAILPEAGIRDWRARPLQYVLDEFEVLARHGVKHVRLADEEFMANEPHRAVQFALGLEELRYRLGPDAALPSFDVAMRVDDVVRLNAAQDMPDKTKLRLYTNGRTPNEYRKMALLRLRASGLQQIYLGVESGCREQLRRMRKGVTPQGNSRAIEVLRETGIQAACGWIMFDPFMRDEREILENLQFLRKNHLIPTKPSDDFVTNPVNVMRVLSGTPLHQEVEEAGLLGSVKSNLLEYEYTFESGAIGRIVAALQDWASGAPSRSLYRLKTEVAHAALSDNESVERKAQRIFFSLKRLDVAVCQDLTAQSQRGEAPTIPRSRWVERSALLRDLTLSA